MLRNASNNIRRYASSRTNHPVRDVTNHKSQPNHPLVFTPQNKKWLGQYVYTHHFAHHARLGSDTAEPTIFALSTAAGRAGIAIVRVSGGACLEVYKALCPEKKLPKPRFATLRTLYHPQSTQNVLDSDALVLYFPSPKTVTGEDVLELHIHGGSATVKAVLAAIPEANCARTIRYAEPGEFTRRAFQNNRLDLAQVEALSDTLSAETEQQRRAAVRGNSRKLGRTYESWREELLYARGELEALIDFSEDQYFDESPNELLSSVKRQVEIILSSIAQHDSASHRGELLKRGIRISLLGAPNAGKSSLLNQIVGREASIVSQEAGTTRDIVEVSLDIRGYLCTFADTAGLRGGPDTAVSADVVGLVEQEGIRRAKAKAKESDIVIAMASVEGEDTDLRIHCDEEALRLAGEAAQSIIVVNKCDLIPMERLKELLVCFQESRQLRGHEKTLIVPISCRSGISSVEGLDFGNVGEFVNKLVGVFENMTSLPPDLEDLLGVTERQRQLLVACSTSLQEFINEAVGTRSDDEADVVIAAEHLRNAANCLARITGRGEAGDVEEVLGVVFEKFCVGK